MAITAQSIVRRVVETIQDTTSIRWPLRELVRYLNDGQREIILYRPDAMITTEAVTLVSGTKQSIPAGGSKLIDITRNTAAAGTKRAIRICNREILDAQQPGWHALTGTLDAMHYMYDPRNPKTFYVYPPAHAAGTTKVEVIYSSLPTDIAAPDEGAVILSSMAEDDATIVGGEISVPDIYANTLQDYMLYRAYIKDSEYAGNAARATAHYGAFANALGIEIKATVGVAPSAPGNPNAPRLAAAA